MIFFLVVGWFKNIWRRQTWACCLKPTNFFLLSSENMVRGLDEDETHFLDEVSRQQELLEKQRREEELKELNEYRISFALKWLVVT